MTLYWWMHWFWITTLNFPAVLFWGASVQSLPSPFVPIVQNGHQNGPYMSKVQPEHLDKSLSDYLKDNVVTERQEVASPSPKYESTSSKHAAQRSLNLNPKANAIKTPDTHLDEISESMSDDFAASETTYQPSGQPSPTHFTLKNPPITFARRNTSTMKPTSVRDTNDNDDVVSGAAAHPHGPAPVSAAKEDSAITWISTAPTRRADERPLGDGPYSSPTDSLMSGGGQSKSSWRQQHVSSSTMAAKIDDASSTEKPAESRGKTVNRERTTEDHAGTGTASTQAAVLYVTPLASDSVSGGKNVSGHELSTVVMTANSSVEQVPLDWNASQAGAVRSQSKDGGDAMQSVSKERVAEAAKQEGLDAATITGIAMGIITAAGLVGAISFVLYRRRYLNKPQTLNDSNPDSSGYLDDSTLREHSEEMYSLDNDSFLNSLEAMTIQNYWTDSVKHTKL